MWALRWISVTRTRKRAKNCAELDGHRAATQHDKGFGESGQAEGRVAGEIAHVLKLRQRRRGDHRPGGNDEARGGELVAGAQFERVRVGKAGEGAQELKLAVSELLGAVIREVLNQGILARHDLSEVEADIVRADAPGFGWLARCMTSAA